MTSRPHPFAPLPPNNMVLPQGVLPPPPGNNAPTNPTAEPPTARIRTMSLLTIAGQKLNVLESLPTLYH